MTPKFLFTPGAHLVVIVSFHQGPSFLLPICPLPVVPSNQEITMSDEVSDFLRSVEELKERREQEDEARSRELEEKFLQERAERQARRAGTKLLEISLWTPLTTLSLLLRCPQSWYYRCFDSTWLPSPNKLQLLLQL